MAETRSMTPEPAPASAPAASPVITPAASPVITPAASPVITMYGADWCSDCRRSKRVLDESGTAYAYVDVEASAEATELARSISGRTSIPVIVFPDGSHVVEPSDEALREKLAAFS